MNSTDFFGPGTGLTDDDIAQAAGRLDCEPAAIRAVCAVETNGGGFLADGRPKILFEALTFHRLTIGRWDVSHPNVSCPGWDRTLYGAAGAHQYDRLAVAMALDEQAALKSASWGMFQIMGTNASRAGFASVEEMVTAMVAGEAEQLGAFANFVIADPPMLAALRAKDWPTLARLYNGPAYTDNHYDTRLAAAYAGWAAREG